MPRTKRVQVLMEPAEFSRLEQIASQRDIAVAELIRLAVHEHYFGADNQRLQASKQLNGMGFAGLSSGIDSSVGDVDGRLTLGRTEGLR